MSNYIAWDVTLPRKPEVLKIAKRFGITPHEAAGRCMEVWALADGLTENGLLDGYEPADVDHAAGLEGFGEAMRKVGWLQADEQGLIFPNWDRWNIKSAKKRAQDRERQRRHRQKRNAERDESVTSA